MKRHLVHSWRQRFPPAWHLPVSDEEKKQLAQVAWDEINKYIYIYIYIAMHLWISDTSPPCTGSLVLCFEKCWPTDTVSVVSPLSVTRLHTDSIHYLFLAGGKTQPWKPAQLWWFLWGYGGLQAQRFCSGALPPCSRWGLNILSLGIVGSKADAFQPTGFAKLLFGHLWDALEWGCDVTVQMPLFKSACMFRPCFISEELQVQNKTL